MNLPESIIVPKGRTSQVSPGLPRRRIFFFYHLIFLAPRNGEPSAQPKGRVFPENNKSINLVILLLICVVPTSLEAFSPIKKKCISIIQGFFIKYFYQIPKQAYQKIHQQGKNVCFSSNICLTLFLDSGSIILEGSPNKTGPQKGPFDWDSAFELDSSPYINENPLLHLNQDTELESEGLTENEGQKPEQDDKKDENKAETEQVLSETDELNSSDIFPLECAIPDFDDATQQDKIIAYLQVNLKKNM